MYLKIIVCIWILAAFSMMGFAKARALDMRVTRLCQWKKVIVLVQGELRFHRATLWECFGEVSERTEEPFLSFFQNISKRLQKKEEGGFWNVWEDESGKLQKNGGFPREDADLLNVFGSGLGHLDLTMQMNQIELAILQTEDRIRLAKEQKEQKGKLYQTMGVTVGMLMVLLLI